MSKRESRIAALPEWSPESVYASARELAEAVKQFAAEAPAEWDGGGLGYEVGGLATLAATLLALLPGPAPTCSCACHKNGWPVACGTCDCLG